MNMSKLMQNKGLQHVIEGYQMAKHHHTPPTRPIHEPAKSWGYNCMGTFGMDSLVAGACHRVNELIFSDLGLLLVGSFDTMHSRYMPPFRVFSTDDEQR